MSYTLMQEHRGEQEVNAAPENDEKLIRAAVSLNARILGLSIGVIMGAGLFIATIWLVIKGGEQVGPNLALLGQYLPGYRVTVLGSFIGFAYGALLGYVSGWLVGWLYNWFVFFRSR